MWKQTFVAIIHGRKFQSLDLTAMELTVEAREILTTNKAAAALLEYSLLTDKNGKQLAPELEKVIKSQSEHINMKMSLRRYFMV